jgi:hypothetical protein
MVCPQLHKWGFFDPQRWVFKEAIFSKERIMRLSKTQKAQRRGFEG